MVLHLMERFSVMILLVRVFVKILLGVFGEVVLLVDAGIMTMQEVVRLEEIGMVIIVPGKEVLQMDGALRMGVGNTETRQRV